MLCDQKTNYERKDYDRPNQYRHFHGLKDHSVANATISAFDIESIAATGG